jgi:hypothetical protein
VFEGIIALAGIDRETRWGPLIRGRFSSRKILPPNTF